MTRHGGRVLLAIKCEVWTYFWKHCRFGGIEVLSSPLIGGETKMMLPQRTLRTCVMRDVLFDRLCTIPRVLFVLVSHLDVIQTVVSDKGSI